AIEVELVAGLDAAVLVDVELQARDIALHGKRPVAVARGMRGEAHQLAFLSGQLLLEQQGFGHGVHRVSRVVACEAGTARSRSFRDCLMLRAAVSTTASARA